MGKDEEKCLFELFEKSYQDMPIGRVEFGDRPDVVVTIQTGETIGIELTECIYDEMRMSESEFQIKFNQKVIAQLENLIPFKFILDIGLDTNIPLRQNRVESTIKGIVDVCLEDFIDTAPYESRHVKQLDVDWDEAPVHIQQHFRSQGYRKLPKGVLRIELTRYDILSKSHHPASRAGVVPDFTIELLNFILKKKENALKNYMHCTQQWLVIGEGGNFFSYMDKVKIKACFKTSFDKVFICRRWNSEVLVLK